MRTAELGLITLAKGQDRLSVCRGVENFEHGLREFLVNDNSGYLLQFGQEIAV